MARNLMQTTVAVAAFGERRRMRRFRMIVELTAGMIANNDELSHKEARCLVECAEKSIQSLSPQYAAEFDLTIRPELERMIRERWPFEESDSFDCADLVN